MITANNFTTEILNFVQVRKFFRVANGCRFWVNADEILRCDHLNDSLFLQYDK